MKAMALGDTLSKKVGYRSVVSQNEIIYTVFLSILFHHREDTLLCHYFYIIIHALILLADGLTHASKF